MPVRYACVVTCRDIVAAHFICQAEHLAPFNRTITQHAGIRCPTRHVFIDKILYDAAPERLTKIDYMMLKTHLLRVMLGFHDRVYRTTPFLFGKARFFHRVIGAERNTDYFVALFQQ